MRDPERINRFCEDLKKLWGIVPDWRFGQLLYNLWNQPQFKGRDTFYIEDDNMMTMLNDALSNIVDVSDQQNGN